MTSSNQVGFARDAQVRHARFGIGRVMLDNGPTAVVRFQHGIEECEKAALELLAGLAERIGRETWDVPLQVINRAQAEAIRSVNDAWGVFSRSRIELLPHQLWVCRKVNQTWPTQWLVADDVGLGKTIEAGMILWPLLARGTARRILVLCPAQLVEQWQYRLRTMFDIRLTAYNPEVDTPRADFWGTHDQVVASLQTLRLDSRPDQEEKRQKALRERRERLLNSDPWDLLLVDEAHHLNADEEDGPTLGYRLVRQLRDSGRLKSTIFFTGTPHRGKDYGFLSLLQLLRPDLFDARESIVGQLASLPQVMIRNNKSSVTDLEGRRLFQKPLVTSEEYSYSCEESAFYELLTEFIKSGRMYASGLSRTQGQAVMLVLIAMQKLASSSVAAIRRALKGRLERIRARSQEAEELQRKYAELAQKGIDAADELGRLEEALVQEAVKLALTEDEEPALRELLAAADAVTEETKIRSILSAVEGRYAGRSVLFFTEYKATQSLLMSALIRRYGDGCVTFINGDQRADDVRMADGTVRTLYEQRADAAATFNEGKARFLVSTEAGGEGIDLQEVCHTLIHVDLPWNPMRLHQRVGRLNRYGQMQRVEVLTVRNPDTVESLIWNKLNTKLDRITLALGQVMDEPEDMLQLVLGMTSPAIFTEAFAGALSVPRESLGNWFDQRTATFGGRDVVETVRAVVGHASHFDFRQVSAQIPRVDLPDLRPFFETALTLNNRKVRGDQGISFLTPEAWMGDPAVRGEYHGMRFDRGARGPDAAARMLGVGHKVVDRALDDAVRRDACVAALPSDVLPRPMFVFRIADQVTGEAPTARTVLAGIEVDADGSAHGLLLDWELLQRLNALPLRRAFMAKPVHQPSDWDVVARALEQAEAALAERLGCIEHGFRLPHAEALAVLWPQAQDTQGGMGSPDGDELPVEPLG